MYDKKRFFEISKAIKEVRIQGARNIAKAALEAYYLVPTHHAKQILMSLRPTEPMLQNVLFLVDEMPRKSLLDHFDSSQKKINSFVFRAMGNDSKIFTHCHSTNVVNSLINAKKKGKRFEVFSTETRPLYQGRKTAQELSKAGIRVTFITDLEARTFMVGKKVDAIFLGADAILKNGDVINKMGSAMFAEIAHNHKIPVFMIADSWKLSKREVKIEERAHKEVWNNAPEGIKVRNIAFEKIPSKYIKAIISELGIIKPKDFAKKAKQAYPFLF